MPPTGRHARDTRDRRFPTRCNNLPFHTRKPHLHFLRCYHTVATKNVEPCASNYQLESSIFDERINFVGTFICPHGECKRLRERDGPRGIYLELPLKRCEVVDEEEFVDADEFDPEEVRKVEREERDRSRADERRRKPSERGQKASAEGSRGSVRHGPTSEAAVGASKRPGSDEGVAKRFNPSRSDSNAGVSAAQGHFKEPEQLREGLPDRNADETTSEGEPKNSKKKGKGKAAAPPANTGQLESSSEYAEEDPNNNSEESDREVIDLTQEAPSRRKRLNKGLKNRKRKPPTSQPATAPKKRKRKRSPSTPSESSSSEDVASDPELSKIVRRPETEAPDNFEVPSLSDRVKLRRYGKDSLGNHNVSMSDVSSDSADDVVRGKKVRTGRTGELMRKRKGGGPEGG